LTCRVVSRTESEIQVPIGDRGRCILGLVKTNTRVVHDDGSYTVTPVDRDKLPTLENVTAEDLGITISDVMPGTRGAYRRVEAQLFTHNTRDGRRFFSTLLGYLRTADMPDGTKLLALDPLMQPRQAAANAGRQVSPRAPAAATSASQAEAEAKTVSAPVSASVPGDGSDEAQDANF